MNYIYLMQDPRFLGQLTQIFQREGISDYHINDIFSNHPDWWGMLVTALAGRNPSHDDLVSTAVGCAKQWLRQALSRNVPQGYPGMHDPYRGHMPGQGPLPSTNHTISSGYPQMDRGPHSGLNNTIVPTHPAAQPQRQTPPEAPPTPKSTIPEWVHGNVDVATLLDISEYSVHATILNPTLTLLKVSCSRPYPSYIDLATDLMKLAGTDIISHIEVKQSVCLPDTITDLEKHIKTLHTMIDTSSKSPIEFVLTDLSDFIDGVPGGLGRILEGIVIDKTTTYGLGCSLINKPINIPDFATLRGSRPGTKSPNVAITSILASAEYKKAFTAMCETILKVLRELVVETDRMNKIAAIFAKSEPEDVIKRRLELERVVADGPGHIAEWLHLVDTTPCVSYMKEFMLTTLNLEQVFNYKKSSAESKLRKQCETDLDFVLSKFDYRGKIYDLGSPTPIVASYSKEGIRLVACP